MSVTIAVESAPAMADVERLHRQLFPGPTAWSADRFASVMADTNHALVVARLDGRMVGLASLIRVRSFSRTAILFEEFVVDADVRGRGIGKAIDRFILDWVRDHTDATRIEGTVNYENEATWHVHLTSGFMDRRNTTILAVIDRKAFPPAHVADATLADLPPVDGAA